MSKVTEFPSAALGWGGFRMKVDQELGQIIYLFIFINLKTETTAARLGSE